MKTRIGFVSNSSSTTYVISVSLVELDSRQKTALLMFNYDEYVGELSLDGKSLRAESLSKMDSFVDYLETHEIKYKDDQYGG